MVQLPRQWCTEIYSHCDRIAQADRTSRASLLSERAPKIGQASTSASTWNEPCRPLKAAGQTIPMLPEASR